MARSKTPEGLGQPIPYDPDFNGPLKSRSCTDIICFFIFIVFIGCWVGIAIYAFSSGDPRTLLVPKDSTGARCGLDSHVSDKPYLFFFDLTKCFSATVPFTGCPTTQICVKECPNQNFFWGNGNSNVSGLICDDDVSVTNANANEMVKNQRCAEWYLRSNSFEKRCIPALDLAAIEKFIKETSLEITSSNLLSSIKNVKALSQAEEVGQNVVDDLISYWWQILVGVAVALLICILYIVLMRWIAGIMVWFSILGVLALLAAAVYFTATKYIDLRTNPVKQADDQNVWESYLTKKDTWLVLLIISSILLGIVLLILIFLRKRILLAIALIKEGSKAVSSVTSVLFFPVFPWIIQVGVIAFAICVGLYLSTTGDPLYEVRGMTYDCPCSSSYPNSSACLPEKFKADCPRDTCSAASCKFITMQNPGLYPYFQAFNVIGFLWGTFFVSALGQMILASVFATWYWTFRKSNLPFFAVFEATGRTLRYHIGTLAFGSLIITICRLIRIALEYIDQKLKKYDNEIVKALLCCCKCFFWCLEKFLKFINRNAYIMCAIHGKNFCTSAKDAFLLLARNIIRVFVLDKVTDFVFFLGKLLITVGVGALAYLFFATDITGIDNSGLNYGFVPVIVIMICTFFISTIFFSVYSMAVDTLFLCFLEDCERNDGSADKPYYMSRNLMKIFNKKNKKD